MEYHVQVSSPVPLLFIYQCLQHSQQWFVESLNLPIPFRVIWCSSRMNYLTILFQLFEQGILKLPALIMVYARRETKFLDEVIENLLCNGLGTLVGRRYACANLVK